MFTVAVSLTGMRLLAPFAFSRMKMNAGDGWPIAHSVSTSLAYHMPTDSWEALPDLPDDRASGGAAVIDHDLHFVGGGRFLPGR